MTHHLHFGDFRQAGRIGAQKFGRDVRNSGFDSGACARARRPVCECSNISMSIFPAISFIAGAVRIREWFVYDEYIAVANRSCG